MRRPNLSQEAILVALASLSLSSLAAGCSKRDSAAPAPEATATAAATAASPPPSAAAASAPNAQPLAAPIVTVDPAIAVVDAGAKPAPSKRGGSAACGAGGCSADMKKK